MTIENNERINSVISGYSSDELLLFVFIKFVAWPHVSMKYFTLFLGILVLITMTSYSQTSLKEFEKGNKYYRQHYYNKAIKQYNRAINKNRYMVEAYINKGRALEFQRKFQEAIKNYDALLQLIPGETKALTRRGIAYIGVRKFEEAVADLEQANKQDPNNANILMSLGVSKIRIKDTSGIKNLDASILLDSTNYKSFFFRGMGKYIFQENDGAINDFETSIRLKPGCGEAYFFIGLIKFQLGDKQAACIYWQQSIGRGYKEAQQVIRNNCN